MVFIFNGYYPVLPLYKTNICQWHPLLEPVHWLINLFKINMFCQRKQKDIGA